MIFEYTCSFEICTRKKEEMIKEKQTRKLKNLFLQTAKNNAKCK